MTASKLKPLAGGASFPIDKRVRIGHAHVKVSDLDHALMFYCGVLGFELMQRIGDDAAFLSAGGYHHHLGLNTWDSKGGSAPEIFSASRRKAAAVWADLTAICWRYLVIIFSAP